MQCPATTKVHIKKTVHCTLSAELNVSQQGRLHVCNLHVAVSVIGF